MASRKEKRIGLISTTTGAPARARLNVARDWMRTDRAEALAALEEIFRSGAPPDPPLAGRYSGELFGLNFAPGLSQLGEWIASFWQPWQGKNSDPEREMGDNVFSRASLPLARIVWPLYRAYLPDGPNTYRAFPFRTFIAPGLSDPDRMILKIDYDLETNPGLTVRRVLDELVQVEEDFFLGKANICWWWGRWQVVAYFTLTPILNT